MLAYRHQELLQGSLACINDSAFYLLLHSSTQTDVCGTRREEDDGTMTGTTELMVVTRLLGENNYKRPVNNLKNSLFQSQFHL